MAGLGACASTSLSVNDFRYNAPKPQPPFSLSEVEGQGKPYDFCAKVNTTPGASRSVTYSNPFCT